MSPGGLSLLTEQELPVGSVLELRVEPPGAAGERRLGGACRLLATVRWSAQGGGHGDYLHGVEFVDISMAEARNRKGIERIMESDKGSDTGT